MNSHLPATAALNESVIHYERQDKVEIGNNLEILRKVVGNSEKSVIDTIDDIFKQYGFTDRQKKACELFLFQPTKKTAVNIDLIFPKTIG